MKYIAEILQLDSLDRNLSVESNEYNSDMVSITLLIIKKNHSLISVISQIVLEKDEREEKMRKNENKMKRIDDVRRVQMNDDKREKESSSSKVGKIVSFGSTVTSFTCV
mmetsp:Transcript_3191/g.5618  ORF Transcript_3191/g.5618 Transcript_3191/m.5618 type:complete len:109 (-) Transcript_3191:214-540(-)